MCIRDRYQRRVRGPVSYWAMEPLANLREYLRSNLATFSAGRAPTALLSHGYNLVYSICTEGEAGTERAVYECFIETLKGSPGSAEAYDKVAKNLMTVFQYLDRWYTVSAGKLRRTRTAEQGKLLPGQTLKEAAQHVKDLSLIHISEPTRLLSISYAVFCLKKKKKNQQES
eukprot:TRINITY_DN18401_c0_g1_i2.p1 TRINITY_DN18401_c0_g1~~TRINITY_DN18401_c0_g1_i2.p1  ORF type:complete len:171 (-),score=56.05 TRINITY_DN18401_c0_g1_i2:73-585(-)